MYEETMIEKYDDNDAIDLDNDYDFEEGTPNGIEGFETVGEYLEEEVWEPQEADDDYGYRARFTGENNAFSCYAQVRVDLEQLIFYVQAPTKADESLRSEVAEYITRANYGLVIGNFEMDYTDGEVRYKSAIDFEGETLSYGLIQNAVYPAVETMEQYLPGLTSVLDGSKTPLEAINGVEAVADNDEDEVVEDED